MRILLINNCYNFHVLGIYLQYLYIFQRHLLKKENIEGEEYQRLRNLLINAIATKILYTKRLQNFRNFLNKADLITLSLPITIFGLYSLPRNFSLEKDSSVYVALDVIDLLVSIFSIIFGIYKNTYYPISKIENYSQGMTDNINLVHETKFVLSESNHDVAVWFLKMSAQLEKNDTNVLADVNDFEKRISYREALKEFDEGNCPYCNSNPNKFFEGDDICERCGNTPKEGYNK